MQESFEICNRLTDPLTTLHGNLEILQDEHITLMESQRFHEVLRDVGEITKVVREYQQA